MIIICQSKNLASPGLMLIGFRLVRYKKISWSQTRQSSSTLIPLVRIFICLFCTNQLRNAYWEPLTQMQKSQTSYVHIIIIIITIIIIIIILLIINKLCSQHEETVDHNVSGCEVLAKTEYISRHSNSAAISIGAYVKIMI